MAVLQLSCTKDESETAINIQLSTNEVNISANETVTVDIIEGNGQYTARSSNADLLTATVSGDKIEIKAKNNVTYAEAVVYVADVYDKRSEIKVFLKNASGLTSSKEQIVLSSVQSTESFTVTGLSSEYSVEFTDPAIASFTKKDGGFVVTGKRRGETKLIITDKYAGKTEILINVQGDPMALAFGESLFGYANFEDLLVVNQSIESLEQVTFEMTCKINSYRGLQTFLGLEGQLIVRGKNDDYRETHPIQIAGLGDKIMLETSSSFNLNEWMNIALVVDCSQSEVLDKYKLYINGVQDQLVVVRSDETHQSINLASSNEGNRFVVGRAFGQDFRAIRGTVAEARVWTTARTKEQIAANLCSLQEDSEQGLLAQWDFSANMATDYILDSSNNQYGTDLILANAKINNKYTPLTVAKESFVDYTCEL